MENLCIHIHTLNGTGSLSANQILTRMIFRSGWPVGSYNFFPSNIAGLPCTYTLRLNAQGFTSYEVDGDIVISLNPKNLDQQLKHLKPQGFLVTDQKVQDLNSPVQNHYSLPFSQFLPQDTPVKFKPLLKNILYVGLLSAWLDIKKDLALTTLKDFFSQTNKSKELIQLNIQAFEQGRDLGEKNPSSFSLKKPKTNQPPLLMDGNTAIALGALFSGCQLLSWYPITPASSVAESFEKWANHYYKKIKGKNTFCVLQTEDEISAFTQVIGAGWTGLRAMTVTSGPGLSLMNEAAGLAYFAEVPSVICNVQRAGPSTGLPTKTQQSDLLSSCFLSHGDGSPIVLMPATVQECFEFTQKAFDFAETFQTLVVLLTNLDLGMNLQASHSFHYPKNPFQRGKVLKQNIPADFARYKDTDGDGVSYRVLPSTPLAQSYLTRGSGHNEQAEYSENPEDYMQKLDKLKTKWETVKKQVPPSVINDQSSSSLAFVTFGNNQKAIEEAQDLLNKENMPTNFMRVRSYPFAQNTKSFLDKHSQIFIVEQNRDGQLKKLLSGEFPDQAHKFKSILQYDGRPFHSTPIYKQFKQEIV